MYLLGCIGSGELPVAWCQLGNTTIIYLLICTFLFPCFLYLYLSCVPGTWHMYKEPQCYQSKSTNHLHTWRSRWDESGQGSQSEREGHLVFSGPGTQMADEHSRMELSDPGVQDEIPCSGMIVIQAAVTSQNLGQDPEQECIMGRSPWGGGGGGLWALGPQERTAWSRS